MYLLFKMGIFHCYVCLPEGTFAWANDPVWLVLYLMGWNQPLVNIGYHNIALQWLCWVFQILTQFHMLDV